MGFEEMLHSGRLYDPADDEIMQAQRKAMELLYDFNATRPSQLQERQRLLKAMFAECGENCYIGLRFVQCCNKGYSLRCGCSRQSVPCFASDFRAR